MSVDASDDFRQKQPLYPDVNAQDSYPSRPPTIIVEQPAAGGKGERRRTFVGHIITSCIVTWCCCAPFGIIAFILAMVANRKSANGRTEDANKMGRASCRVSMIGAVVGFIAGAIILGVYIGLELAGRGYFQYVVNRAAANAATTTPPP